MAYSFYTGVNITNKTEIFDSSSVCDSVNKYYKAVETSLINSRDYLKCIINSGYLNDIVVDGKTFNERTVALIETIEKILNVVSNDIVSVLEVAEKIYNSDLDKYSKSLSSAYSDVHGGDAF